MQKRYSQFLELKEKLVTLFPAAFRALPFPPKTFWPAEGAEPTVIEARKRTVHSSKERRRPLFWQPFSAVTEPAPGLLVPLSGILASRRRKQRKNEKKRGKNGRDMA